MEQLINPQTGRPFVKDFFKDYARRKPCMIRVASTCGFQCASDETTVLCHITLPGLKAMGKKLIPDLLGAWGCMTCHDLVDGRVQVPSNHYLQALGDSILAQVIHGWHMDGMARTIEQLVQDGLLPNPI